MKAKLSLWGRTVGATVAAVYFLTNVALAYSPEKNLWAERRRHIEKNSAQEDNLLLAALPAASSSAALFQSLPASSRITSALSDDLAKTLPLTVTADHAKLFNALQTTHGTIRKVWMPAHNAGERVVVHIQDVHQNEDTQRNIGGAVESLMQAGQAGVVGLEGSSTSINVQAYHDFEDREVIRLTADYLLKENKITGPVHAAMTTPAPLSPMLGVDDPIHYVANVDAYRQSAPKVDAYRKAWAAKKFTLAGEKKVVYSPDLLAFDGRMQAYHERNASLADYVEALAPQKGLGNAGLLAQAFEMEKKLDFSRAESDRKEMIEALVKTLTQDQINQLTQESTAYRLGEVRYGEFYVYLKNICHGAKIDLAKYPHMDAYIRYVLVSDRIDAEKLLTELAELEKARYGVLAKTSAEETLINQSRALGLAGRLLTFELSPEEWAEYGVLNAGTALGLDMSSFEAFYKEAHARDESLSANLLKAMDEGHFKTAVLVTGGYHTNGVSERLVKAGVTVVTFTPRIEKIDSENGSAYLSIFTQEKTPLEKLFAGEKLFLGEDAFSKTTQQSAPVIAGASAAIGKNGSPETAKKTFELLGGVAARFSATIRGQRATVRVWASNVGESVRVIVQKTTVGTLSVQQTVVVAFSFAMIAAAGFPFVSFAFGAISGSMVSLGASIPGVSAITTLSSGLVAMIMGQSGHFVAGMVGSSLAGFSVAALNKAVMATALITFMAAMAEHFGKFRLATSKGQKKHSDSATALNWGGTVLLVVLAGTGVALSVSALWPFVAVLLTILLLSESNRHRFAHALAMIAPALNMDKAPRNEIAFTYKVGEDKNPELFRDTRRWYSNDTKLYTSYSFLDNSDHAVETSPEDVAAILQKSQFIHVRPNDVQFMFQEAPQKTVARFLDSLRLAGFGTVGSPLINSIDERTLKALWDGFKRQRNYLGFLDRQYFWDAHIHGQKGSTLHVTGKFGSDEFRFAPEWWKRNKDVYTWDFNTPLERMVTLELIKWLKGQRAGNPQDWDSMTAFLSNLKTAQEERNTELVNALTAMLEQRNGMYDSQFIQILKLLAKTGKKDLLVTVRHLNTIIKMRGLRDTQILDVFGEVKDLASVRKFLEKVEKLKREKPEREVVGILESYFKGWASFDKGADLFLDLFMRQKPIVEDTRKWYGPSKMFAYTSYSFLDNSDHAVETSMDDVAAILQKSQFIHVRPNDVQFMFWGAPQKTVTWFLDSLRLAGFGTVGSPLILEIDPKTLGVLWKGFNSQCKYLGFSDWRYFADANIRGQKGSTLHVTGKFAGQEFRFAPEWWKKNKGVYTWDFNTPLERMVSLELKKWLFGQMAGNPQDWDSMTALLSNLKTAQGERNTELVNALTAMLDQRKDLYDFRFIQILKLLAKTEKKDLLKTVRHLNTIIKMRGLRDTQILTVFGEVEELENANKFVAKVERLLTEESTSNVVKTITDFFENWGPEKNADDFLNSFNPGGQIVPNSLRFLFTGKDAARGAGIDSLLLTGVGVGLALFYGQALALSGMVFFVLPLFAGAHVYAMARNNPRMSGREMVKIFSRSFLMASPYLLTAAVPFLDFAHGTQALLMAVPATFHLVADSFIMGWNDAKVFGDLLSSNPADRLQALMGTPEHTTDVFAPSMRTIERMASAERHTVLGFVYRVSFRYFAPAEAKVAIRKGMAENEGDLMKAMFRSREVVPASSEVPTAIFKGMVITRDGIRGVPALLKSEEAANRHRTLKQYYFFTPGEGVTAQELSQIVGSDHPIARVSSAQTPEQLVEAVYSSMGSLNLDPIRTRVSMLSVPSYNEAEDILKRLLESYRSANGGDSAVKLAIVEAIIQALLRPIYLTPTQLMNIYQAEQLAKTFA